MFVVVVENVVVVEEKLIHVKMIHDLEENDFALAMEMVVLAMEIVLAVVA